MYNFPALGVLWYAHAMLSLRCEWAEPTMFNAAHCVGLHVLVYSLWLRPNSHRTQDATHTKIGTQILWCYLRAVWILPLTTTGPILLVLCCASRCVSCVNGALTEPWRGALQADQRVHLRRDGARVPGEPRRPLQAAYRRQLVRDHWVRARLPARLQVDQHRQQVPVPAATQRYIVIYIFFHSSHRIQC